MSDYLNNKYHLEMKVLSPLHIGAGQEKDWMKGADYVIEHHKLYKLNHKKLLSKLSADELSTILLTKDDESLKRKISGNVADVADEVFDAPTASDNDIKGFIKNGLNNKPFVPGSSIKGALRSIILNYLLEGSKPFKLNEREFFGDSNKGDEFMRFVKVSDVPFNLTQLTNTKIFNLYGQAPRLNGGWKQSGGRNGKTTHEFNSLGFNTIYEIIAAGETGCFTLSLSDTGFDNLLKHEKTRISHEKKKSDLVHLDIQKHLFKLINEHTIKYIQKQMAFFNKYPNNETDIILDSLTRIREQIPSDNTACVLQMSGGSGFHSITGDWKFDDFSIDSIDVGARNRGKLKGAPSAKSRKIATNGSSFELMGFVKLSVLSEELIAQRAAEQEAKAEADRKAEEQRKARILEEKQRAEAERLARFEAERQVEAERLEKERLERKAVEDLLQQKEDELKESQEANALKKETELKEILSNGLVGLKGLNDFEKGKKITESYYKANNSTLIIDPVQIDLLKQFVEACISKSNKRWKKTGKQDWVLVVKWVGKEMAQQWYTELTTK